MRENPTSVMMFSAGFGTRMKHLTQHQPKPLVHVADRPLIDHTLDLALEIQPKTIVANLHYLPEMLETHLANTQVQTLREEPDILETGGGLRNALHLLGDGPVFTTNTDAIWSGPNPFKVARDAWKPDQMDALLVCIPVAQTAGYNGNGDFTLQPNGRLKRGPGLVYGGVQIVKTDLLEDVTERAFSLNVIWNLMQAKGRLFGVTYSGRWCDLGHPGGIAQAEALLGENSV